MQRIYPRYRQSGRSEKGRILHEFCANCGYNRKYAIRLLNGAPTEGRAKGKGRRRRGVTYGAELVSVLKAVWEAADYPWSVRLKALLPGWMPWIRRHYRLSAKAEGQLLQISARSIDRRLRGEKRKLRRRLYGCTKPGSLLKHHIPLKTDHWDVQVPGFTEIDLVSHSGNSASGEFCYSLNVTDIHTGWTETQAVLGKSQEAIRAALEAIRRVLPFPLRGIDSDNGSEFINAHLVRYCEARAIQFTRGRPYKKDDNAHIEQKNWTHVRRQLGYVRYDTEAAREAINDLYANELRLFQNLFLPSVKLAGKARVGSRLRRRYEAPQTPFERVLASAAVNHDQVAELRGLSGRLDPFHLSASIRAKLEGIFQLSTSVQARGDLSGVASQAKRILEKKTHRRALATAKDARGEKAKGKNKDQDKNHGKENRRRRVTFLGGRTIHQKLHSYVA
ncbi:MAG: integrase catalytic domain-containing protein [Gammaproteobacteria bacterium]